MANYTFNSLDRSETLRSSCELEVPTDEEARAVAEGLLSDEEFHIIELRKHTTVICRLVRA